NWAGLCVRYLSRPRASIGDCCRASRNSTRRGDGIWVRARAAARLIRFPREHRTYSFPPRWGSAGRAAGVDVLDLRRRPETQEPASGDVQDVRSVDARPDPVGLRRTLRSRSLWSWGWPWLAPSHGRRRRKWQVV